MKTQKTPAFLNASTLAQALSVSGLMAASFAHAQALTPASGSGVEVTRQNNVPVIQIVKPSAKGLSHNRFTDYNTGAVGVIVNNAQTAVGTTLAGQVQANPNLSGGTAKVILNEVVSGNRSTIEGRHEIAGDRAALIIANPNGITANNAGFINTSRATLAAGRVEVADGAVKSIVTDQGATLRANGVGNAGGEQLDLLASHVLIAPNTRVEGGMMASVIGGATRTDYAKSGRVGFEAGSSVAVDPAKPFAQTHGVKDYDVSVLGSVEAGRINVVGNHVNRGIYIQGASLKATEGDMTINGQGGNVTLNNEVTKTTLKDFHNAANWWNWGKAGRQYLAQDDVHTREDLSGANTLTAPKGTLSINGGTVVINTSSIDAKNVDITGNRVDLPVKVTHEAHYSKERNTINFWTKQDEVWVDSYKVHASTINASGDVRIQGKSTLLDAATVNAQGKLRVEGSDSLTLNSSNSREALVRASVENNRTIINAYSEGGTVDNEKPHQTTLTGKAGLGVTGGEVNLNSASLSTEGDALINASGHLRVGDTKFATSSKSHENWSNSNGAFGGYQRAENNRFVNVQGSTIAAGGEAFLTANKGVDVIASVVKAKSGVYGDGGAGDVRVDVSTGQQLRNVTNHNWTVFGIVTKDDNSQLQKDLVTGSVVHSDADINLLTKADVRVIGSLLEAADNLNISADGVVAIEAAKERTQAGTQKLWWTTGAKSSTDANGNTTVSVSLKQNQERTTLDQTQAKSANLTAGGAINITAGRTIGVQGSNLTAGKDVNLVGQDISVTAANETKNTTLFKQEAGITLWATGGPDTIGLGINIGVDKTNVATNATTPKPSTITAGGDVNRAATGEAGTAASNAEFAKDAIGLNVPTASGKPATGSVTDVGTQITAGGTVTNAGTASSSAASGSSSTTTTAEAMNLSVSKKLGETTVAAPVVTRTSDTTTTPSSTAATTNAAKGVINVTSSVRRVLAKPPVQPSLTFTGATVVAK